MTTKIVAPVRREIVIDGQPYTVTISPDGVKITLKGYRHGTERTWRQILALMPPRL